MERLGALIPAVGLIFLAMFMFVMVGYSQAVTLDLEQFKLQYAVRKSTDAAIDQLLYRADRSLMMDVHDLGAIQVNPQIALDTYVDVFLANYRLPINAQNQALVKTRFMPIFAVITNDGYYLATMQQVSSNVGSPPTFDLAFSYKYPFTYERGGGLFYNLTLSQQYVWELNTNTGSMRRIRTPDSLMEHFHSSRPVAQQRKQTAINLIVLNHMANEIARLSSELGTQYQFYIPADLNSVATINTIQGTSVLAIMQNVNLTTTRPLSTISLGGARIMVARMVVGYMRNGRPMYAFHDSAPPGITIQASFTDPHSAAAAGYHPDLEWLIFREPGHLLPGQYDGR
jgi:hypothetical protein